VSIFYNCLHHWPWKYLYILWLVYYFNILFCYSGIIKISPGGWGPLDDRFSLYINIFFSFLTRWFAKPNILAAISCIHTNAKKKNLNKIIIKWKYNRSCLLGESFCIITTTIISVTQFNNNINGFDYIRLQSMLQLSKLVSFGNFRTWSLAIISRPNVFCGDSGTLPLPSGNFRLSIIFYC